MKDPLNYYQSQSVTSSPGKYRKSLDNLPNDIKRLCNIVHGLLIHRDNTGDIYHFKPSPKEYRESNLRYVENILGKIFEKDNRPLTQRREPKKRCFATCRDYSLLLCSILRHKGVPARVRCGFTIYFDPEKYWDHWVCEYWNKKSEKWALADPEVGKEEISTYGIDPKLNFIDLPRSKFVVAGQAWQMFRSGRIDPDLLGVHSICIYGAWFIRANVLRDLAALNKIELLPWDYTNYFYKFFKDIKELNKAELKMIHKIASLTVRANENDWFSKIRSVYQRNQEVQVGQAVKSYSSKKPTIVKIKNSHS